MTLDGSQWQVGEMTEIIPALPNGHDILSMDIIVINIASSQNQMYSTHFLAKCPILVHLNRIPIEQIGSINRSTCVGMFQLSVLISNEISRFT